MTGADLHDRVVVNQEEQYAIWPAGLKNPPGWRDAGAVTGTPKRRTRCLRSSTPVKQINPKLCPVVGEPAVSRYRGGYHCR